MGNLQAADAAKQVRKGVFSLRDAVMVNLSSNHFPPLPAAYADLVIEAINHFNGMTAHDIAMDDFMIELPEDLQPKPRNTIETTEGKLYVWGQHLLGITHCWDFVEGLVETEGADRT